MQIIHKVLLQIGADTSTYKKLFWLEDQPSAVTTINSYTNESDGLVKITPQTVGSLQPLSLGTLQQVCGLYVEVDSACVLNFNSTIVSGAISGGFQLPLLPSSPATGTLAKFFAECTFTSLIVSATGGTVNGLYCMWGDPAQ